MPHIKTRIDRQAAQFTANTAAMHALVEDLRKHVDTVSAGGGAPGGHVGCRRWR